MSGRLPEQYPTDHFSAQEQAEMSKLIHRVKDCLMGQKGFIATPVHYAPRFTRNDTSGPDEQYGLLQHRTSPTADRRSILVSKKAGVLIADFHIDYGVLSELERGDPDALKKREAQHATGLKRYLPEEATSGSMARDLQAYLLDGLLPVDTIRTASA